MLKIYLKCNNYNRAFSRKGGSGGPPPENVYNSEDPGLHFWRFLKQIRKRIVFCGPVIPVQRSNQLSVNWRMLNGYMVKFVVRTYQNTSLRVESVTVSCHTKCFVITQQRVPVMS
jgi:hypothetical protein